MVSKLPIIWKQTRLGSRAGPAAISDPGATVGPTGCLGLPSFAPTVNRDARTHDLLPRVVVLRAGNLVSK